MHFPIAKLHDGKWHAYDVYHYKDAIKAVGGKWHPNEKYWEIGLEEGKQVLPDTVRYLKVRVKAPPICGTDREEYWASTKEARQGWMSLLGWDDDHHRAEILEVLEKEGL